MPLDPPRTIDPVAALDRLRTVLAEIGPVVVACSGGIDSLTLATVAVDADERAVIAHTVTPAVPSEATARVVEHARIGDWDLRMVRSKEFEDERYLSNPTDRCYFCKTNLYDAIDDVRSRLDTGDATIVSGANLDDLGEYRPGLIAADEHDVRHPFVEASISKPEIRAIAARLGLAEADLPASPCLASRLYTGTRVTAARLHAVEVGEAVLRQAGAAVVRCRLRDDEVVVEVPDEDRALVTPTLLGDVLAGMQVAEPSIERIELDRRAYRPGQAIVVR